MQGAGDIRYATGSGVSIAWTATGEGPPLILVCDGFISIEAMDEDASFARCLSRLSRFTTLLRFDRRGVGLSDPPPEGIPVTVDDWVRDVVAVLDDAGVERAWVMGAVEMAGLAVRVAATHPDRVLGLVLTNASARGLEDVDYPIGFPSEVVDAMLEARLAEDDGDEDDGWLALVAPSAAGDPAFRRWWQRAGRRGASPAAARRFLELVFRSDVRADLPQVTAPCLVMHRRDCALVPVAHGRFVAEHLPDARFLELDGADVLWWIDADRLLDEIELHVVGSVVARDERVHRVVLFTDIVGSTQLLESFGDAAWSRLLDAHDRVIRRALQRYGGTEVHFTGDGVLALFHGPDEAVACAHRIRADVAPLGLSVRAGLHVGPVAQRLSDVAGLTVHVAARVASLAGAGEVLCTAPVVEALTQDWQCRSCGAHELRGVQGSWQLTDVRPGDEDVR